MGRVVELVVLVNGMGGIAVTVLFLRARMKRKRRREQLKLAQKNIDEAMRG